MPTDFGRYNATYSNWYLGRSGVSTGTVIKASAGRVFGIFISSTTVSSTIALTDSATGGTGTVISEFSAGTPILYSFPAPIAFSNGISIISSGSVNLTVFYE